MSYDNRVYQSKVRHIGLPVTFAAVLHPATRDNSRIHPIVVAKVLNTVIKWVAKRTFIGAKDLGAAKVADV